MSERTEQLILMLTPEEKALIEGIAREWDQTPSDYIVDLVNESEAYCEPLEPGEEPVDIEENIRQAFRDIKEGRTREITSIWDILDEPDDIEEQITDEQTAHQT